MKAKWWFAGETAPEGYRQLLPTTKAGSEDRWFRDAQKMTIAVEGIFVAQKKDNLSGNDLIVSTKHQRGDRPQVDRVHFYRQNVKSPNHEGPFFHPVVFATQDFREQDTLFTIGMRIYDEDGFNAQEAREIEAAIVGGAASSAVAFPAFAPYAGLAAGVGTALVKLVDTLDDHDCILDATIALNVNKPADQGYDLLQPGFLVCFESDIDVSQLRLGDDRRVYRIVNDDAVPYETVSYAVLRVRRDFLPTPDYAIDEKVATLLAQLDSGKGQPGAASLRFLRETLDAYTNYTRLQRYTELAAKTTLTDDEKALLAELKGDQKLTPYLPTGR